MYPDERAAHLPPSNGPPGGRPGSGERTPSDEGAPGLSERDDVLSAMAMRVLNDLDASAVTAYLYDPTARKLVAAVAAVTPLGTGSVERVPADDRAYASAEAFRTGEVTTGHSVRELGKHPELAVFAPFPFTVSSAPLGVDDDRFGAMATYWPRMFRELSDAEHAYLRDAGADVGRELRRLADRRVPMRPSAVPRVLATDGGVGAAADVAEAADARPTDWTASNTKFIYHLHKLANALIGTVHTEDAADLTLERVMGGFDAQAVVITLAEGDRLRVIRSTGCSPATLRELNGRPLGQPSPETDAIRQKRHLTLRRAAESPDGSPDGGPHPAPATGPALGDHPGPDGDHAPASHHGPDGGPGHGPGAAGPVAPDGVRPFDAPRAQDTRNIWVVIPMLAGGKAIGSCSIGFGPEQADVVTRGSVLVTLAPLLGQTFERTRLYDAQYALAQRLQQTLLPRMLPQLAGVPTTSRYVMSSGGTELGGDWYDLINLPAGGIAAVIGDVQGHNISAAVVMGQVRSAVRAYMAEGHSPGDVLSRTNRLLVELDTDLFATCCGVWLDPATGVAEIASAGHHRPLIRFPDGHYEPQVEVTGLPMGIEPDVHYDSTKVTLTPGTLIVLYTDGMVGQADGHPEAAPQAPADPDEPVDPDSFDDLVFRAALEKALTGSGEELEALGDRMADEVARRAVRPDDGALLILRYEGSSPEAKAYARQLAIHRRDLQGVRRARQFLRDWLRSVHLVPMTEEAELLASEIITNALVHGDTDVDIHVRRYPEHVRVEVRDSDPHLALPGIAASAEDEGGRGLVIVSALASAWGNSPSGRGKTVWFELPTPERDRPAGEDAAEGPGTAGTDEPAVPEQS